MALQKIDNYTLPVRNKNRMFKKTFKRKKIGQTVQFRIINSRQ